jgi:hypothetical protein
MGVDEKVKKNWVEIQKKFDYPVNAIGVKIASTDEKSMSVWRDEGMDSHMKR